MAKTRNFNQPEIRIKNIDRQLHQELVNISDHMGVPMSTMLRPVLREFRDKQPEHYLQPYKYKD